MQQYRLAQHRQVADATSAVFVHRQARALTAAAQQRPGRIGHQRDLNEIGTDLEVGHMKTLPEREAGFNIEHGNGGFGLDVWSHKHLHPNPPFFLLAAPR